MLIPLRQPPFTTYTVPVQKAVFFDHLRQCTEHYSTYAALTGQEQDRTIVVWHQIKRDTFRVRRKARPRRGGEQSTYAPWLYGSIQDTPSGCYITTWFGVERTRYVQLTLPFIVVSVVLVVWSFLSVWSVFSTSFTDTMTWFTFLGIFGLFWFVVWRIYNKMRMHPEEGAILTRMIEEVIDHCSGDTRSREKN